MDAFYASVEVHDDPSLAGLPVVVGGPAERRGVVAAASYEARRFGIHSAMPMARAAALCPSLVRLSPRMARYREVSGEVMDLLRTFSPLVEPLSLDEAFVDLTGTERSLGPPVDTARQMKAQIAARTGLTASVGLAPNKFLAKLASDLQKPNGLTAVTPEDAVSFVQGLPVERLWGVGEKTAGKLHRLGMHHVLDLAQSEPSFLKRHFGVMGLRLHELAWARDERPVVPETEAKSVSHEITFAKNQRAVEILQGVLMGLCEQTARRLRQSNLVGRTVNLKLRYGDFATIMRQDALGHPSDDAGEIYAVASRLLESERATDERSVRLIGVGVTGLLRRAQLNLDLFTGTGAAPSPRTEALHEAVDALERRFGEGKVTRARSLRGETAGGGAGEETPASEPSEGD
jgi:DNA polymerase-4